MPAAPAPAGAETGADAPTATGHRRWGRRARPGRESGRARLPAPVLLVAPSLILMAALFAWPLVLGVGEAVTGHGGPTAAYLRRMVADPYFWPSVRDTFGLIVVLIPIQFALAVAMALLLRARPRLAGFHFYVWAVPLAISDLAAGLVWLSIFTDRGYLNSVLADIGLGGGYSWLSYTHPVTMFLAVMIAELWRSTSLVLLIVVAGLQGIPNDYDEAAAVFGASYRQRLWHVILPQLRPSLQVALILRTILALQTFAVAQALTGNNFPLMVWETYNWYVNLQDAHVAAAIALTVLAVSLLIATVYLWLLRDRTRVRS